MNKIDFRIADFTPGSAFRKMYNQFLSEKKIRQEKGLLNEFEPDIMEITEIEQEIGFTIGSVMVLFFPYMTENKLLRSDSSNLSFHAASVDYHYVCKKIMRELLESLDLKGEDAYIQCDNGFFNERFFALNTGLCAKGLNAMAIHPRYGSYGFLGLIVTHKKQKEYLTIKKECKQCKACIKNCPGQAIGRDFFCQKNCLSYLTQKKVLSIEERASLAKQTKIYGCDMCQLACPENFNIKYTEIEDFKEDLLYNIGLEEINSISNKEFKARFSVRSFSWRGKKILKRNIEIVKK